MIVKVVKVMKGEKVFLYFKIVVMKLIIFLWMKVFFNMCSGSVGCVC